MAGETPSETLTDPGQARTVPAEDRAGPPQPPESDFYELDGELAHGGMGRIWRARDRRLDRPVAVKQLLRATPETIRLFEREVRVTARLQHPSIVSVYEAGRLPTGEPFFAMKLVAGHSLKDVVHKAGGRDARLALLPSVIAIADALAYAHEQGVIHRDLKPSNVLVGDFGETVVIDWGLAKEVDRQADSIDGDGPPDASRLAGTPAYMAPEVAWGDPADARTDVYAIGAILYEVLSGASPYRGQRSDEVLGQVRAGPPPPLHRREPGLPRDLLAIVAKAMARDPDDRYPSARELAAELRRFQTGQLVSAHRYSVMERIRRFAARHRAAVAVAAAALTVLVVLSAIGVGRIVRERDRARERADRLALAQARQLLERDPAQALAALGDLSPGSPMWGAARVIAADALHRGTGRGVYREGEAPIAAVAAPDGRLRVVVAAGETLRVIDGGAETALDGHAGGALAVAMTPDGRSLASVDADGGVRLWSLGAGGPRLRIDTRAGAAGFDRAAAPQPAASGSPPTALAIAADGDAVALAMRGGALRVIGADGRQRALPRRGAPAVRLALSSGSRWLAAASGDGVVTLIDLAGGAETEVGKERALQLIAFSPAADRLAIGGGRVLRLVPTGGGPTTEIGHDGEVGAVAFAADGARLASGAADGLIRIWSADGQLLRRLAGHRGPVRHLAFSADGSLLVSAGDDHDVRLWSAGGDRHRVLGGHGGWGSAVRFAGDDLLITAGWDHQVRAQQLSGGVRSALGAHAGPVRALLVVPGAGWAASAGDDRTVRRWRLPGGPGEIVGSHQGAVLALDAPEDGRFLVSGGADHDVKLWLPEGGRSLARATSAVHTVATTADGAVVLWAGADQVGMHWLDDTELIQEIDGGVTSAALRRDGYVAAAGRRDGRVLVWFVDGRGKLRAEEHGVPGAAVRAMAFSPDGRRLAWAAADGSARVLTLKSRVELPLVGHRDLVRAMTFSPDGERLATAGDDGTVRLWDAASGEGRALARPGWVADVAFSPDGLTLASIGVDGRVHLERDDLPRDPAALRSWIAELAADLAPPQPEAP